MNDKEMRADKEVCHNSQDKDDTVSTLYSSNSTVLTININTFFMDWGSAVAQW